MAPQFVKSYVKANKVGGFLDDVAQTFFQSRLGSSGNCEETPTNGWAVVAEV